MSVRARKHSRRAGLKNGHRREAGRTPARKVRNKKEGAR